jgi:hypothetical protein
MNENEKMRFSLLNKNFRKEEKIKINKLQIVILKSFSFSPLFPASKKYPIVALPITSFRSYLMG